MNWWSKTSQTIYNIKFQGFTHETCVQPNFNCGEYLVSLSKMESRIPFRDEHYCDLNYIYYQAFIMHNHKFLSICSTIVDLLDTIFIKHKYCYKCGFI